MSEPDRPPLPPFSLESARAKVQAAEDAWNTRDPDRVVMAYTPGPAAEIPPGLSHEPGIDRVVRAFLRRKWAKELDYRLKKELWCFSGNRIAVRFEYEWHDDSGSWFRAHGNEMWEFADNGQMRRREASINDVPIREEDRKFRWERKA